MYMKSRIVSFICCGMLSMLAHAQVDPVLTSAVTMGDANIRQELVKIKEKQNNIATLQAAIFATMTKVHDIEDKTYSYLSNASVAVKNLHQIVEAGELTVDIVKNLQTCSNAAIGHPRGTIVSALVSKRYTKAYSKMISLYSYIKTLVLTGNDGGDKVNLLNSGERLKIATDVVDGLKDINFDIQVLTYQINYWRWADLITAKDPKSIFYVSDGKAVASEIIRSFSNK